MAATDPRGRSIERLRSSPLRRWAPRVEGPEPDPPPARGRPGPLRDHGLTLLAVFTASMLVMVGLAAVIAVVGRWWILVPVMMVDLAVTTAVLASFARLLNDGDVR